MQADIPIPADVKRAVDAVLDDQGNIYLSDMGAGQIVSLDPAGVPRWSCAEIAGQAVRYPAGLAIVGDRLWVADSWNRRVCALSLDGDAGETLHETEQPVAMTAIADGVLVADHFVRELVEFSADQRPRIHERFSHALNHPAAKAFGAPSRLKAPPQLCAEGGALLAIDQDALFLLDNRERFQHFPLGNEAQRVAACLLQGRVFLAVNDHLHEYDASRGRLTPLRELPANTRALRGRGDLLLAIGDQAARPLALADFPAPRPATLPDALADSLQRLCTLILRPEEPLGIDDRTICLALNQRPTFFDPILMAKALSPATAARQLQEELWTIDALLTRTSAEDRAAATWPHDHERWTLARQAATAALLQRLETFAARYREQPDDWDRLLPAAVHIHSLGAALQQIAAYLAGAGTADAPPRDELLQRRDAIFHDWIRAAQQDPTYADSGLYRFPASPYAAFAAVKPLLESVALLFPASKLNRSALSLTELQREAFLGYCVGRFLAAHADDCFHSLVDSWGDDMHLLSAYKRTDDHISAQHLLRAYRRLGRPEPTLGFHAHFEQRYQGESPRGIWLWPAIPLAMAYADLGDEEHGRPLLAESMSEEEPRRPHVNQAILYAAELLGEKDLVAFLSRDLEKTPPDAWLHHRVWNAYWNTDYREMATRCSHAEELEQSRTELRQAATFAHFFTGDWSRLDQALDRHADTLDPAHIAILMAIAAFWRGEEAPIATPLASKDRWRARLALERTAAAIARWRGEQREPATRPVGALPWADLVHELLAAPETPNAEHIATLPPMLHLVWNHRRVFPADKDFPSTLAALRAHETELPTRGAGDFRQEDAWLLDSLFPDLMQPFDLVFHWGLERT